MRSLPLLALALATGCAHKPLSGRDLDRVSRPAFISRIEDGAGPRSWVFRGDGSYGDKLKKLQPKEADRRLTVKLTSGSEDKAGGKIPSMSRFQISDTLRATTLSLLPKEQPWTNTVKAADVAATLQSFLVEEVPANAPDYELLRPLGVDAVVEFVVEEYGMRSEDGRAGCYVVGYGRMFFLEGGGNVWFRSFRADQVDSKQPHVDPFKVAKDPQIFRSEMTTLLKAVAEQFAKDLNPGDRRAGPPLPEGRDSAGEDSVAPRKNNRPEQKEDNELPDPI
jgi:hypothetical protein